jgi:CheY-like chemotaxis protein
VAVTDEARGSGRTVVVADDEDDVRLLFGQRFRRELRSGDIVFEFASSGEEALRLLENAQDSVLILSDINMPGMTGFQLLERIRDEWPDLDVYLVTAYDSDDYRQQALDKGASGYFTKPLDFPELKRILLT